MPAVARGRARTDGPLLTLGAAASSGGKVAADIATSLETPTSLQPQRPPEDLSSRGLGRSGLSASPQLRSIGRRARLLRDDVQMLRTCGPRTFR